MRRPTDKLLDDILRAADVAEEITRRGRGEFETDPVAQFGAEAVIGRIGDAASKLPEEVRAAMPGLPWKEIIGFRIVVDHAYHRLDYRRVWNTLWDDIPRSVPRSSGTAPEHGGRFSRAWREIGRPAGAVAGVG